MKHEATTNNQEALRAGMNQLVHSLNEKLESGEPGAVQQHFQELLAGSSPEAQPERAAAFELLAAEQGANLEQGLASDGSKIIDALANDNNRIAAEVDSTGSRASLSIRRLQDDHRSGLGRMFNSGNFDARRAARAHEDIAQGGRGVLRSSTEHEDAISRWARKQRNAGEEFAGRQGETRQHQAALAEGSKFVAANNEAEQKDLNPLIDGAVTNAVAQKVEQILGDKEALVPAEDALIEALQNAQEQKVSAASVTKLAGHFLEANALDAATAAGRCRRAIEGVRADLRKFDNRGQSEYPYARRPDDAQNLFRQQNSLLMRLEDDIRNFVSSSRQAFNNSAQTAQAVSARVG